MISGSTSEFCSADNGKRFSIQNFHSKLAEAEKFAKLKSEQYKTLAREKYVERGIQFYGWQYPYEFIYDENIGRRHRPNSVVRHILRTDTSIIYDAIYSFDQYGRRSTPVEKKSDQKKFLILFGCSMTYGNGVNDNQTLNYFLAKKLRKHYPYNYAIGASGPNSMLALIENTSFNEQITEPEGIFVYVYLRTGHIARATGKFPDLDYVIADPYYTETKDGALIRAGTFDNRVWQNRFYRVLNWFNKTFRNNKNRIIPPISSGDFQYVCKVITESKNKFLAKHPNSQFLVYSHPLSGKIEKELHDCLKQNKINTYNGRRLGKEYKIPIDHHPNAKAYFAIANELAEIIENEVQ